MIVPEAEAYPWPPQAKLLSRVLDDVELWERVFRVQGNWKIVKAAEKSTLRNIATRIVRIKSSHEAAELALAMMRTASGRQQLMRECNQWCTHGFDGFVSSEVFRFAMRGAADSTWKSLDTDKESHTPDLDALQASYERIRAQSFV